MLVIAEPAFAVLDVFADAADSRRIEPGSYCCGDAGDAGVVARLYALLTADCPPDGCDADAEPLTSSGIVLAIRGWLAPALCVIPLVRYGDKAFFFLGLYASLTLLNVGIFCSLLYIRVSACRIFGCGGFFFCKTPRYVFRHAFCH